MEQEMKHYGYKAVMVTFTYNEDSIPKVVDRETGIIYHSVCKKHPQNLIKRFRMRYKRDNGNNLDFTYFLTSEYGPRTLRPHYHAIFFGVHKVDIISLLNDWNVKYGFTVAKNIKIDGNQARAARYVAKYCSKGMYENPYVTKGIVLPTFHLMSKGIGKDYLHDPDVIKYFNWTVDRKYKVHTNAKSVYTDEFVEFVGTGLRMYFSDSNLGYALPRYYKQKLYGTQNDLSRQVADFLLNRNDELYRSKCRQISTERGCSLSEASYHLALQDSREMETRENEAKRSLERFYNKSRI